jgi:hypothetical protein
MAEGMRHIAGPARTLDQAPAGLDRIEARGRRALAERPTSDPRLSLVRE